MNQIAEILATIKLEEEARARRRASTGEKAIRSFYRSWQWATLRYQFLRFKERRCACCGQTPADGARMVVDHIVPVRKNWSRRLDPTNLQILCDDCNRGKGSNDQTRWADQTKSEQENGTAT